MFVYKAREGSRNIPLHIEVSDIDFNRAYIPGIPDTFYFVARRTPRSQTLPLPNLIFIILLLTISYLSERASTSRQKPPVSNSRNHPATHFHPKSTPPQIQAKKPNSSYANPSSIYHLNPQTRIQNPASNPQRNTSPTQPISQECKR
jgi:hypothetical protein